MITFPLHIHTFSLHMQNLVQLLLLGNHWVCIIIYKQCLDSMNKEEHVALLKGTVAEERDNYIHLHLQATLVVFLRASGLLLQVQECIPPDMY